MGDDPDITINIAMHDNRREDTFEFQADIGHSGDMYRTQGMLQLMNNATFF